MTKTLKEVFHEHIDVSSEAQMEEALCVMDAFVEDMRHHHPDEVEEMICEVEEALSPYLSEEESYEIVKHFENSDGTKGPHWSKEQTTEAADKYGIDLDGDDFKCLDWFVVMNMVYSDYYHSGWGLDVYVNLAKDFLCDKDFTKPGKAKWYFMSKKEFLSH